MFVVWPESEMPLREEIRLALAACYDEVEELEELEPSEELIWGVTWRVSGAGGAARGEYLVWAESRGDLSDEFLRSALPPVDYEAARNCRWLIGVETRLDVDAPQASFQEQLRFISEVAVPGLVGVYDDNALIMRSGQEVRDLCACPVPPRAGTLYATHAKQAQGAVWLHTHGLLRTGVPDLDLVGLPPECLDDGEEMLHAVVDALLAGMQVGEDGRIELGEGLTLRLASLTEAMPAFPSSVPGGLDDRTGEMADHAGDRMVLLDATRDEPPVDALVRMQRSSTLYKSRDETERQRTLSLARWGTFGQLFAMHRGLDWSFHVKMAYEQPSCGSREHLWFEVLELRPGRVPGRLICEPVDVPHLKSGEQVWHPLDRLTDWLIVTPQGSYDPELAGGLLEDPL